MSRRRVSVKDLGEADCQGWLQRRKECRTFLSSRWKRFWFVLKKSCLYWYTEKTAEKAEGFISLSGFSVQQARVCRKKHAISVSHPQVVDILIAAESFMEMNRWISKLSEAVQQCELTSSQDCYSEDSDQDEDECESASLSPDSQLDRTENKDDLQLSCGVEPHTTTTTLPAENRSRTTSVSRPRRRRGGKESPTRGRLSWLDLPMSAAASLPLVQVTEEKQEAVVVAGKCPPKLPDEMENQYNHLKADGLSPAGQSSHRDFRASFMRRCHNEQVNEKVHLLRILSSTLKAKESELLEVDQILNQDHLTGSAYRKWKLSNPTLLQEISRHVGTSGGAAEPKPEPEEV